MANSWNGPQLGSPIRTDVPELQKKLIALLKGDPTSVANIPSGAKRLVNTSGTQWQVQQYNGSSWAAIGKLMHDVDKLDGYHAAITPAARTVAVRNADKKLEGDITGNAATASSAATLSETLPVSKGGTGATTSAAARTNLGVPPASHASSSTTYGLGTDTNYGHVRSDGDTTNIVAGEVVVKDVAIGGDVTDLASERGIFNSKGKGSVDYNTLLNQGFYAAYATGSTNGPGGERRIIVLGDSVNDDNPTQIAVSSNSSVSKQIQLHIRSKNSTEGWSDWVKFISEYDFKSAVLTSGNQTIGGNKVFSSPVVVSTDSGICRYVLQNKELPEKRSDPVSSNIYTRIDFFNGGGLSNTTNRMAILQFSKDSNGNCNICITANNPYRDDAEQSAQLGCGWMKGDDGVPFAYAYCPTPAANSNNNYIATTGWVRSYTIPTGALIPSLATSMTRYLLCNGAAVSRTTYANLFSIIGTKFGAGDGSTTFNLPDFRNRVFWGASGNLMSVIEAGLPDHSHSITVSNRSRDCGYESGSPRFWEGFHSDSTGSASASNAIYGKSTTVQPPAIAVNIFIKY